MICINVEEFDASIQILYTRIVLISRLDVVSVYLRFFSESQIS